MPALVPRWHLRVRKDMNRNQPDRLRHPRANPERQTMPRFTYISLVKAAEGREEEMLEWYRSRHLVDVVNMPGVVSGKLFQLDFHRVYDLPDAPQWTTMVVYELEGDDPEPIVNSLRDASGTAIMPSCDAVTKGGMIQVAGHLIAEAG